MNEMLYWLAIGVLSVGGSAVVWWMYYQIQLLKKKNEELLQQKDQVSRSTPYNEITPYKLDPHLLKNALSAIQSHAYHSYHSLDKLSNVLDYILYESNDSFVKVKDEVYFAQNLIEINRLKVSPLFDLHMRTKISTEVHHLKIAPFITINPIENAFKHADLQSEDSFISIVMETIENTFLLSVTNKIQTQTIHKALEHGGIGNKAFKKRLDMLYGKDYTLITEQKDNTYHVKLEIKLHEED